MVIRIRLARFGRTNAPFYNIVVAHARTARNSRPLEVLGTYDPTPRTDPYDDSGRLHKDIKVDVSRARYWVGVGAQPSDTAWRLLAMIGLLPKKVYGGPTPTAAAAAQSLHVAMENAKKDLPVKTSHMIDTKAKKARREANEKRRREEERAEAEGAPEARDAT